MRGLSVQEIADLLGISVEAAKKRLMKARKAGLIEPMEWLGRIPLYPESALDAIRATPGPGRPRKPRG